MLTMEQLSRCFETDKSILEKYLEPLIKCFDRFEINTSERIAMFLAQVGHESAGLKTVKENLNYSAERLIQVFPKYFRNVSATSYARNPEKIANRVYANRMGNGPEESGDGWKYRGRGAIQLTGKDNYGRFAKSMGMKLEDVPAYLETPEGAIMSAGWFWDVNKLNESADAEDVEASTRKINGGVNGLDDRKKHYKKIRSIIG